MMIRILFAAAALAAPAGAAAPSGPVAPISPTGPNPAVGPTQLAPADVLTALMRFEAPAGWKRSDYANNSGADAVVSFANGLDRIAIYVYGNHGTAYKSPADFLKGPAASTMGKAPVLVGSAPVAGKKTDLYRRAYPLMDSDPHAAAGKPPRLAAQTFCILPPVGDGRFVVLTYSREAPAPDPSGRGESAWKAFLTSVSPPLQNP
jgi:hypothetical protein